MFKQIIFGLFAVMCLITLGMASVVDYMEFSTVTAGDGIKSEIALYDEDDNRVAESGVLTVIYYSDAKRTNEVFKKVYNVSEYDFEGKYYPSWKSPRIPLSEIDTTIRYYESAEFKIGDRVYKDLPVLPNYPMVLY